MLKRSLQKSLGLQDPPLDPKIAALYGPLENKVVGSGPWIMQMTAKAQGLLLSLEHDTSEWLVVRDELDGEEVWKKYPADKPYGTREAYYREEFGRPEPELTQAKIIQQLQEQGRRGKAKRPDDIRSLSLGDKGGTGRDYIRARLERDGKTELLAQVERGEISAHRAAKQAGYRKQTVCHQPTVQGFLKAAKAHLSPAERLELKEAL
jgi:hypothetical protein